MELGCLSEPSLSFSLFLFSLPFLSRDADHVLVRWLLSVGFCWPQTEVLLSKTLHHLLTALLPPLLPGATLFSSHWTPYNHLTPYSSSHLEFLSSALPSKSLVHFQGTVPISCFLTCPHPLLLACISNHVSVFLNPHGLQALRQLNCILLWLHGV